MTIVCLNCGYIKDIDDEGEYCSYCLSRLDFENNIDEFFDILETEVSSLLTTAAEVENRT